MSESSLEDLETLKSQIHSAISEFLREELDVKEAEELEADAEIWDTLDSLALLELIGHLEERFKVEIAGPDFAPRNLKTMTNIVDFTATIVAQKRREQSES